jgi:hypothetical protein
VERNSGTQMSLTLPSLIERLGASCRVVMRRFSRMVTSARCSISGLAAVIGRPERGTSWSYAFPDSEAVTPFAQ